MLDESTIDTIFDSCVIINNGMLMYGARKEHRLPYELSSIYDIDLKTIDINEFDFFEIYWLTLFRRCSEDDKLNFLDNIENEYIEDKLEDVYRKYKKGKTKDIVVEYQEPIQKNKDSKPVKIDSNGAEIFRSSAKVVEIAKKMANILSPKRASDYNSWIRVGWALHNIDYSLLDTYIKFSKKCQSKYQPGCCEKIWRESRNSGLTINSLYWWANEDNPKEYNIILRESISEILLQAMSGTHDDVANTIYELYKPFYKCTDLKADTWYEFQKHKWVYIQSGYTLSAKISDDLAREFAKTGMMCMKTQCENQEGIKGDDTYQSTQKLLKLSIKLKDHNFKKCVMKECAQKFYDPKFEEKLDSNLDLIGFENGVYDLKLHHFRNGVPDDYIKMSVGYDYKDYRENSDEIKEVIKYFKTVQLDEKMRQYVLRFISSCLSGSTKNQKFFIWTGSGANGKSTTEKLIEYTFGEYYKTMPNEVMTRKSKAAGGPKPELADKRGVRIVFMNEPEGDDTLGVSKMKEFTGGEKTDARAPYGQLFYFKPQFKMVLCCNKLPTIMARDGGTWRRLRVTAWESKFVEYTPKKEKEFKIDPSLLENISVWKEAFMWYLINIIYPQYEKFGLDEPPQVTEHTKKYQKDSDIYYEFLSEFTSPAEGNEINCAELYLYFKDWYKENYTNKYPVKKEFVEYLSSIDMVPVKNIVTGLILKMEDNGRNINSV
jgi:P4 family phage/plasmid primase-like protien